MIRAMSFGLASSAVRALLIASVSGSERYSTPSGDRYCTDCALVWPAASAGMVINAAMMDMALNGMVWILGRPMRFEEGVDLAHRQGNPLLRFLPGEHAHFRLRRQHRALHRDRVRMGRGIVRQDQNGCLATAQEIACHGENEVGIGLEHSRHEPVRRRNRDLGPLGSECRTPRPPEDARVF